MKRVYLLTTGGTIGTTSDKRGTAILNETTNDLLSQVNVKGVEIIVKTIMSKASANFEPADWQRIAIATEKVLRKENPDGIVILHGTDTLQYTAAALSFMLTGISVPIVITGSMIPGGDPNTDAVENLRDAIKVAAFADFAEICVVFSMDKAGRDRVIIRASRARKMHSYRLNAFESINAPPIGIVSGGSIRYLDKDMVKRRKRDLQVRKELITNVVLVKQHPALIKATLKKMLHGAKAAVVEGTGGGHVKEDLIEIFEAFDGYIALTSQTIYGGETVGRQSNYEIDRKMLKVRNFIPMHDMISETALVKMMWALALGGNVRSTMLHNVAGEISF